MKLSNETLAVLKNFAEINDNLVVKEGNLIRTISPQKNVMAQATVKETFDVPFNIYDLKRFMAVMNLFSEPELDFKDKYLEIASGTKKLRYAYADAKILIAPPEKELKLPSVDITVMVSDPDLAAVREASKVMQTPDVSFRGDGESLTLVTHDKSTGKGSDGFSIVIGKNDVECSVDFKNGNLNFMEGDYEVEMSKDKITKWGSDKVTYWVAAESSSTFSA